MNAAFFRFSSLFFFGSACIPWALAEQPKEKPKFKLTAPEQKILDLTNAQREKKDLPPLRIDPLLTKVARAHSANMAKKQEMKHVLDGKDPRQRLKAAGYPVGLMGENIGAGPPIPAEIMKGWMGSKPHRANILNKNFTHIGIGMARDARGEAYYTQVFATRKSKR